MGLLRLLASALSTNIGANAFTTHTIMHSLPLNIQELPVTKQYSTVIRNTDFGVSHTSANDYVALAMLLNLSFSLLILIVEDNVK